MIELLTRDDFDEMFAIMEESFPKDEYRTRAGQRRLFEQPEYQVYAMRDEDTGSIKGFIAIWDLKTVVFVEHFAVNPRFRNGGLGSKILQELKVKFDKPLCLEVELPENEMAVRRIGFYERNGFFLNRYPYKQLPLAEGQKEIPLYIMTTGNAVDEKKFQEIRELLYTTVYQFVG